MAYIVMAYIVMALQGCMVLMGEWYVMWSGTSLTQALAVNRVSDSIGVTCVPVGQRLVIDS